MKLSKIGRASLATIASLAMGLGMTACGGGTVAFLWVTATKTTSNGSGDSITGFKVDDYTGNLTEMVKSPYSAAGTNPVMGVVAPGGRFIYVVNKGDDAAVDVNNVHTHAGANIAVFSVGGDGVLNFQRTYDLPYPSTPSGTADYQSPVYAQMDSSGQNLYVLASKAPLSQVGSPVPDGCELTNPDCGAVFVYSVVGDTGRLTLVQNQQKKVNGVAINYFPTGPTPFQMRVVTGGYLAIANNDQKLTLYTTTGTSGQITLTGNQLEQTTSASSITSVTGGGSYIYVTDGTANKIYAFTVSSNGLGSVVGSPFDNGQVVTGVTPVWTTTDSTATKLYVLNQNGPGCPVSQQKCNSISAYTVDSNGKLTPVSGINNPYTVGAGPTCILQDPSTKYIYTSNATSGSVTGYEINKATGELNVLRRGSEFTVTGKPTCLMASGAVD